MPICRKPKCSGSLVSLGSNLSNFIPELLVRDAPVPVDVGRPEHLLDLRRVHLHREVAQHEADLLQADSTLVVRVEPDAAKNLINCIVPIKHILKEMFTLSTFVFIFGLVYLKSSPTVLLFLLTQTMQSSSLTSCTPP
jgi:hypothetical protein